MRNMTITFPPTTAARALDDARLAADLGRVLEEILEHTAHGLVDTLARHGVDPLQLRLLRQIHESLGPDTPGELARRTGFDPGLVEASLIELADRGLIVDPGHGFGLTPNGRRIVIDIARARREDLIAFVSGLSDRRRLRFDAAVHLLSGELDAA
jgi:hypothetical protein